MSDIRLKYLCEGECYKGDKSLNMCSRVNIFGSIQFPAILLNFFVYLFILFIYDLFNETVTQPVASGCVMVLSD